MDLDNKNIGSFPVEMTGDHTFLSYSGDDPEDVIYAWREQRRRHRDAQLVRVRNGME